MQKKIAITIFLILCTLISFAQKNKLYTRSYGSPANPPIIFLHGGPGYNCAGFEATTSQKLSDAGYYVIVYDQRGCGRSKDFPDASFTLAENIADLDSIYNRYHLKKATLMGHSWGGTLATYYSVKNPQKVNALILVSSPISYPATFKNVLVRCKQFYTSHSDTASLKYITMLEKMDTTSLPYSSYIFYHASACGLYTPKQSTKEREEILSQAKSDAAIMSLMKQNDFKPIQGIYNDIKYITVNTAPMLNKLKENYINIYGIYGTDDGLFDDEQLNLISTLTGKNNFYLLPGASHNVFIDQQPAFVQAINKIMH